MNFRELIEATFVVNFINSLDNPTQITKAVNETNQFLTGKFPGKELEVKLAIKKLIDAYFIQLLNGPTT